MWGLGFLSKPFFLDHLLFMSKDLTPAQAKALKKQQKQAQRAARKEQGGNVGGAPQASQQQHGSRKHTAVGNVGQSSAPETAAPDRPFAHLDQHKPIVSAADIHPAILNLALQMRRCNVLGSTQRCVAMMEAFSKVIEDYQSPPGTTLGRSLAAHLSRQIEVLKVGRALSVSQGNAIRWLKQHLSAVLDFKDVAAKEELQLAIKSFVRERLEVAAKVIVKSAGTHIRNGDTVLTFGHSSVVYQTLAAARKEGKEFSVICVDTPPLFEGKRSAVELVELEIPTSYILISAVPYLLDTVTTVMVGAHAMVSNGHLYSRVGTSLVAMAAFDRNIPMLVLCETLKFSERIQLDAFSVNEMIPGEGPNSVFYDLTDSKYISKVITEVGALPASSVPVILREYKTQQV